MRSRNFRENIEDNKAGGLARVLNLIWLASGLFETSNVSTSTRVRLLNVTYPHRSYARTVPHSSKLSRRLDASE